MTSPVGAWQAILAVADMLRERGHEVVIDGANLTAAEDAAAALLAALVQPAPVKPAVRPEVVGLLADTVAPAGVMPHEWTRRDGRRLTPDEQRVVMSATTAELRTLDR